MSLFKDRLCAVVGPRLRELGYQYDDALRDRDLDYGFKKHLGDDIHVLIVFQRQQHEEQPIGYGFTVNLRRCKTSDLSHWHLGGYEGFLNVRLGAVICYVHYRWRHCPYYEQWWIPTTEEEMEAKFLDALEKLETYGIPWLEDPKSKTPGGITDAETAQFRKSAMRVVSPELKKLGFGIVNWGGDTLVCFGRKVFEDMSAFLVFSQAIGEGQEELGIQVRLFRNKGIVPDRLPQPEYEGYLGKPLDFVLRYHYGLRIDLPAIWPYSSEEELERQLEDLVGTIKRYAVPWLEDPLSTNQLRLMWDHTIDPKQL